MTALEIAGWVVVVLLLIGAGAMGKQWIETGKPPTVLIGVVGALGVLGTLVFALSKIFRPSPTSTPAPAPAPTPTPGPAPRPTPAPDYVHLTEGGAEEAKEAGEEVASGTDAEVGAAGAGMFDPGRK